MSELGAFGTGLRVPGFVKFTVTRLWLQPRFYSVGLLCKGNGVEERK